MIKHEDTPLDQSTDARTNQRVAQLPLTSQGLAGLAKLREQWASMPMIPRLVLDRREGIDDSWAGFDVRTILIGRARWNSRLVIRLATLLGAGSAWYRATALMRSRIEGKFIAEAGPLLICMAKYHTIYIGSL